ncbi:MAG: hypothetical protein PHX05_00730 [Acidobacteriota bacterium]|nr:hypothetical protein [Acidobacteriota bacterium]
MLASKYERDLTPSKIWRVERSNDADASGQNRSVRIDKSGHLCKNQIPLRIAVEKTVEAEG